MPVRPKGKLLTIFCLLWISAHSSDTLVVDHSFQQIDILSVGSLYSTADADRNIGEVQQLPLSDWTPLSTTGTVLYSLDQVYWVKSTLKNEAQQIQSVYVEVGNKRINELQFFVRRDTGLFTSEVTGDYHPFHRRVMGIRKVWLTRTRRRREKVALGAGACSRRGLAGRIESI